MQRNLFEIRVIYKGVLTTIRVRGTRNLESLIQQVLVTIFLNFNQCLQKYLPCIVSIQKKKFLVL